jgi:N-acetylglucosaminyl-diphospho-decaprenol L-rhamnosyltransferase
LKSDADFFIVTNPDIRIKTLCLESFVSHFLHENSGIVGPAILNPLGKPEDSAREFPKFYSLFLKLISFQTRFVLPKTSTSVDWIAGMFMIIPKEVFRIVGGFDHKRFFMYYEDVDICLRVRDLGYDIIYDPSQSVIHDAQRASRRSFRHMQWHLTSMFRYLSGL